MISICIPIYNYYAYPLVRRLATQIERLSDPDSYEIVCIDDHSSGYYLNQNMGICDLATYLRLNENIGRARIRNLFLKYAKGEWLMFLDNDSVVPDNFLRTYLKETSGVADVVVGGRVYDQRGNDSDRRLRYLYGTKIESQPVEERERHPYRSFMTNNFMVRRTVLESIKFDARLTKYGHEDTLFGYQLEKRHVPIRHIDNAVVNGYVETNLEFLNKSIEAVENLVQIYDYMWEEPMFARSVNLLKAYTKVRRMRLHGLVHLVYRMLKPGLESSFVSGKAISLKLFSFYKLGTFIHYKHYNENKK